MQSPIPMEGKVQTEKENQGCGSGRWYGIGMAEMEHMVSKMELGVGI